MKVAWRTALIHHPKSKADLSGRLCQALMAVGAVCLQCSHTLLPPESSTLGSDSSNPIQHHPTLYQKLCLLLFFCVYTQRCRDWCFVPLCITQQSRSKTEFSAQNRYLYVGCTAAVILQPLTPRSCSHGGQPAYKLNEII